MTGKTLPLIVSLTLGSVVFVLLGGVSAFTHLHSHGGKFAWDLIAGVGTVAFILIGNARIFGWHGASGPGR